MNALEKARFIAQVLDSKKGEEIKILRIKNLTILTDYFVIAGATSSTQLKALADEVEYKMSEEKIEPHKIEGYHSDGWILMDYGDVVVHIFHNTARDFYCLEKLWADGEEIPLQAEEV